MPGAFLDEREAVVAQFNERAPASRDFGFPEKFFWQNKEEKTSAAIAHELLEFGAIEEAILQRVELTEEAAVAAMLDFFEVVRIELGKERFRNAQGGVMNTKMFLQNLAATVNGIEPLLGCESGTVVATKIDQSLLTFENSCALQVAICGDVRPVATAGQTYFQRARGVAVRLRPDESEAFETKVPRRFTATVLS